METTLCTDPRVPTVFVMSRKLRGTSTVCRSRVSQSVSPPPSIPVPAISSDVDPRLG